MDTPTTITAILIAGNVAQSGAIIWLAKQNAESNKKANEATLDATKKVLEANNKTVAATLKQTEKLWKMINGPKK